MSVKLHWWCAACRAVFKIDSAVTRVWLVPRWTARWIAYCSVACRESHEAEVALVYAAGGAAAEVNVLDAKGRWSLISALALHTTWGPYGVWRVVRSCDKPVLTG